MACSLLHKLSNRCSFIDSRQLRLVHVYCSALVWKFSIIISSIFFCPSSSFHVSAINCGDCEKDGVFHQYAYEASSPRICDTSGYWTPDEAIGQSNYRCVCMFVCATLRLIEGITLALFFFLKTWILFENHSPVYVQQPSTKSVGEWTELTTKHCQSWIKMVYFSTVGIQSNK